MNNSDMREIISKYLQLLYLLSAKHAECSLLSERSKWQILRGFEYLKMEALLGMASMPACHLILLRINREKLTVSGNGLDNVPNTLQTVR